MSKTVVAPLIAIVFASFQMSLADEQDPLPDSNADKLRSAVFEGSFKSGAAVRYHELLVDKYEFRAQAWRWAAIVTGFIVASGPIVFYTQKAWPRRAWYGVSFAVLLLSIAATFTKANDQYANNVALEKQWSTLAHQWDSLLMERDDLARDNLKSKVDNLRLQQALVENAEPPGTPPPEWMTAWNEEARVRQIKVPKMAPPNQQAAN